ncbi:MAG: tetratricopeptide repeat protein [Promethearchaeota archaeon]
MGDQQLFEKALSLYSKRKYQEALSIFEALDSPSLSVLKYYYLGLTYVQLGRLTEGLEIYRKIREVSVTESGVGYDKIMYGLYINMGSLLQALGKKEQGKKGVSHYQEAADCYQYALDIQNTDERVWNNLGNAFLELEQYDKALDAFNKALEIDDEYPEAYYCKSLAYESLGQYDKAIENLEIELQWKSRNKLILNRLAALLFGTREFNKAEGYAHRILETYPEDPMAHKNLALILYNQQKYKEAYHHYLKLMELQPEFSDGQVLGIFTDLKNKVNSN